MSKKLGGLIEQAIEEACLATSVDSVEGRRCSNDRNDGIEYEIRGEFIEIRPIIEAISNEPYIIDEFNVSLDEKDAHMNIFVVEEEEVQQSKLSTEAWI